MRDAVYRIRHFMSLESIGGFLLFAAAGLAIALANSPLDDWYRALLDLEFGFAAGEVGLAKTFSHWVNDGLMALFFLLVGLEIKRELVEGHLSGKAQAILPLGAALGGVMLPAIIYLAVNAGNPEYARGWAIPSATDIAFSLAVLQLFGSRVPLALKVLLTAIAVIDDLAAVLIIAFFYSGGISFIPLGIAILCVNLLMLMNYYKVTKPFLYVIVGIALWLAMLQSGIHATCAGVLLGLTIPLRSGKQGIPSPLRRVERALHPWVVFLVLPVFAFCNSGISLQGVSLASLAEPLPLGIILGLFFGKQLGIFGASYGMVKLGAAKLPEGCGWAEIYGIAILAGIGFTMSLFIGTLAFPAPELENAIRLSIIVGSLLSATVGYFFMRYILMAGKRP